MSTVHKTLRYILVLLAIVAGAAFFYMIGLGTGLYIAQSTVVAFVPPTATPLPATPTWTPESPTPSSTPAATPTPAPTAAATQTPPAPPTPKPSAGKEDAFKIFWEAWHVLQDQFYGDLPTEEELQYEAIKGVIASTGDQYTAFLDPVRAEIVQSDMSGSFEGIGATVRMRPDGQLEIVQPLPGQPATKAGLRPMDVVLEVDDVEIAGMSIYEAISLIRGPAGTVVRLLIERENVDEPFEVQITRARIEFPVVETEMLDDDIAYLRLNDFGETSPEKVEEALRELLGQDPRGLIFDLRGNGGGYLSAAVEVGSQFVEDGPILVERFRDDTERTHDVIPGGLALDVPLVVLVNGGTASASEIVAGAIQDTERGVLIGTKTLGKGSVQLVNTLSDGSQLRVTTAHWFTPNDRAIHGQGLTPDIEVEISEDDIEADRDPQLERAIAYLAEGK